jgi:hypothetical protein
LKLKLPNTQDTNQKCKDFIHAFEIHSEVLFEHCSCYSDTRGVTTLPLTEISLQDLEGVAAVTRNNEQSHISSLWQHEVRMARTKKVLAFPCCFFFRVIAPLYLEELDYFTPHDTILLIQDLEWVLRV